MCKNHQTVFSFFAGVGVVLCLIVLVGAVKEPAVPHGDQVIQGKLTVTGDLVVEGNLSVPGDLIVKGKIIVGEGGRTILDPDGMHVMRDGVEIIRVARRGAVMPFKIDDGAVQFVANDFGWHLLNHGQRRAFLATEERKNPQGEVEPGITELVFDMPDRDPKTWKPILDPQSGQPNMKRVFTVQTHDGFSPGRSDNFGPETWTCVRLLNGAGVQGGNSPVFEAFSVAPWSPVPDNEPNQKAGASVITLWGKDLPTHLKVYNAFGGDKLLMHSKLDSTGTTTTFEN